MKKKIILIIILFIQVKLFTQISDEILYKRLGEKLVENNIYNLGLSRFLQWHFVNSSGNYNSPGSIFYYNSKEYRSLPFNLNSVDLLPADPLTVKQNSISTYPTIKNGYLFPKGKVELINEPIKKELTIRGRLFTGSETGDPLIYYLTRQNLEFGNINKFVPSGVLSFENSFNNFAYRIKGGYFGYYPTGSINDGIIWSLNSFLGGRQNKQAIAAFNSVYKLNTTKIIFDGSFVSYYGFDLSPFTNTFFHSENYLHSLKLSFENLAGILNVDFIKDGTNASISEVNLIPGSKFILNNYIINSQLDLIKTQNYKLSILNKLNLDESYDNYEDHTVHSQKIFNDKNSELRYTLGVNLFNQTKIININSSIIYDINFDNSNEPSGIIEVIKNLNENNEIKFIVSSVVKYPTIFEKNASFITLRNLTDLKIQDTVRVQGNIDLKNERNYFAGISFKYEKEFYFSSQLGYHFVENPIGQNISNYVLNSTTRDFAVNSQYDNFNDLKVFAAELNLNKNIDFIGLNTNYKYSDRNEYFPKHTLFSSVKILLPISSFIRIEYFYKSKSYWKSFDSKIFNIYPVIDKYSPEINEVSFINISYQQELNNFYFFNKLSFKIEIENLFNNEYKNSPFSNELKRAVIVYFNALI